MLSHHCLGFNQKEAIATKRPYRAGGVGDEESNLIRIQLSRKLTSVFLGLVYSSIGSISLAVLS